MNVPCDRFYSVEDVMSILGVGKSNWNFNTSNPVVFVGGNYSQNGNHGLFYVNYTNATNANANLGSRFL